MIRRLLFIIKSPWWHDRVILCVLNVMYIILLLYLYLLIGNHDIIFIIQ